MATDSNFMVEKGVFSATVGGNRQIGPRFYRISLEFSGDGSHAFAKCQPGQFAELDLSGAALPKTIPEELADASERQVILRRPFSFCSVSGKNGRTTADILYCTVGPASLRMTTLKAGDVLSVVGPLGRGFRLAQGKKQARLVRGGMGAGPLEHLSKVLTEKQPGMPVIAFAGAKTAKDLPFDRKLDAVSQQLGFSLAEFAAYGIESLIATDDGSRGYNGAVTDLLEKWISENRPASETTIIYSCGPEAMLKKVSAIAGERRMDCQISMERLMACGIGLCQSCAVQCKGEKEGETVYKLCCKDGPVFEGREVVFD